MSGGTPIAWSQTIPGLQIKMSSSTFGPYKQCPRRYYYEVVLGLASGPPSVDLEFGGFIHEVRATYKLARAAGADHEEGVRVALLLAQTITWDAKRQMGWQSGDPDKNRLSLLRLTVEYLDHWEAAPGYTTMTLATGRPAVELKFEFDTGVEVAGEAIKFVGTLDEVVRVDSLQATYVLDTKSTKMALGTIHASQFTPDNQFSLYAVAARVCFHEEVRGVLLDAVSVKGGRFEYDRVPVTREEPVLNEWLEDSKEWLMQMGRSAQRGHWPQNDKSCGLFKGCPWRPECGASPKTREFMLRTRTRGRAAAPGLEAANV